MNDAKSLSLGARVKIRRDELDVTQETLAERVGLSQNHISQVERGKRGLSQKNLRKVATALDTSVSFLSGETNYSGPPLPSGNNPFAQGNKKLMEELAKKYRAKYGSANLGLMRSLGIDADSENTPEGQPNWADIESEIVDLEFGEIAQEGYVFEYNKNGKRVRIDFSEDTPENVIKATIAEIMKFKEAANGSLKHASSGDAAESGSNIELEEKGA
jgi:transcriptional regulator with XRE-family HTH domain